MTGMLGGDVTVLTRAIIENAKRLGLLWTRRLATVVEGSNPAAISATFDADSQPISMTSMIGPLAAGQRVYVDIVPPSGNFIVGRIGHYEARQTLTASAASVTFSSIPAALSSLRLTYSVRSDNAVSVQGTLMRINSDAAPVYSYEYLQGANVTATAVATAASTSGVIGLCNGTLVAANRFATGDVTISGWDLSTPTGPGWVYQSQGIGTLVAVFVCQNGGGVYEPTVATKYSSITIFPAAGNFIAGCDFQLVGEPS